VTQSHWSFFLLARYMLVKATHQNCPSATISQHQLGTLLFLLSTSVCLHLSPCGGHVFPTLLPALKKLFHILVTHTNRSLARSTLSSGVVVDIRGSDEVVEQLRRGMARFLPLGSLHIGFREALGRFSSGYGWTGFCCNFRVTSGLL
jgi:hypothetical protein